MRALPAFALAFVLVAQWSLAGSDRAPVIVDVIAADAGGRMVVDLTPADFEILDEGRPRSVESVRLVRADGSARREETYRPIQTAADERIEASRDGTRLFAFFLDEYHVAPGADANRAREVLGRFVDRHLGPSDLVLIVKPLDSLVALKLTRGLDTLRQAIAAFEGRKGELEPRGAFEKNYFGSSPARIAAVREQIVTSALHALARHLGGLGPTRKSLVVVSEGFQPRPRERGEESLPTLDGVIRAANRGGVSIYAIDPHGLAAPVGDEPSRDRAGQEALRTLADETGGRAILQASDLADGLSGAAADASGYYLIAFRSEAEADGRFHRLEIRMRRPGVQLRARSGYWAPMADAMWRSRLSAGGAAALPPELPRRISPLIRPWFGQSRGDAGRTRVSFVWEPVSRVPGDLNRTPTPVRVTLKASAPDGVPLFEGAVDPTAASAAPRQPREAPPLVFDAPPGRLRVQIAIEDATARVVDTDVRDLIVGPLSGPVVLGTASVLRASSARAFRALAADPGAAPVAARDFSRTERLLIRVPLYAVDPAAALGAKLVSPLGQTMRELAVTRRAAEPEMYEIDLPLAGLAPGAYLVALTATSVAGQARENLAFRVIP